jgi:hypothetical protein
MVTGPSVVRSGATDPEVEPQWLALIVHAGVFEWPRAASGCLTLAADPDPTVSVLGASSLCPWGGSNEAKSTWA